MVDGFDVLDKLETVETTRDGIFVMPKERITILSTYVYSIEPSDKDDAVLDCQRRLSTLQDRFDAQALQIHHVRSAKLP